MRRTEDRVTLLSMNHRLYQRMRSMKIKSFLLWTFIGSCLIVSPGVVLAEYGDIIMNGTAAEMKKSNIEEVVFPHWFHRIRFKCKACHEHIYLMKAGANETNMNKILAGESCGTCHNDEVAWGADYCDRCHSRKPGWVPENYPKKIKKEKK